MDQQDHSRIAVLARLGVCSGLVLLFRLAREGYEANLEE